MKTSYACSRVILALAALIVPILAHAYTNQWAWQAVRVDPNGVPDGTSVNAPPTEYATKQLALAALQGLPTPKAYLLTQEEKVSSADVSGGWIEYKYKAPLVLTNWGPWTYYSYPTGWYATEAEQVEATRVYWQGQCPNQTVSLTPGPPLPNWTTPTFTDNPRRTQRTYLLTKDPTCQPNITYLTFIREQTGTCPAPYSAWSSPVSYEFCADAITGYIKGHPVECVASGAADSPSTEFGNPCDAATGAKTQRETDYEGAGLPFVRSYNSGTLAASNRLGVGWTHNYSSRLILCAGTPCALMRADGYQDQLKSSSGSYISLAGSGASVKANGSNWDAYRSDGGRDVYNSQGQLIQIISAGGATTTLAYGPGAVLLQTVTGPFGHVLTFAYDNPGNNPAARISQITLPGGSIITYSYDAANNLTGVTYPDATTKTYLYTNASFPNHLTGIVDESGTQYSTFVYDSSGRATETKHPGDVEKYTLAYGATSTTITPKIGTATTLAFTNDTSARHVTGTTTGAITRSWTVPTYATDPQRRPTVSIDARGYSTTYTYDTFHLLTKTEASGTALARTTTYTYGLNNDSLPSQITEPTRRTNYTYDTGRNLLTRTVTDLATLAARTTTYTHDSYGRMLTEDGPRSDVSDTTTYTYYTCTTGSACGQLLTITNALGQVTTFNTYNSHGQPLTITEHNGTVTTLTYDARQHVLSANRGGETTSYQYYPTGLLKRITLPDGSYRHFTVDTAHRMYRVADNANNRLQYTLDAMSHQTSELAIDPAGVTKRQRYQVWDALQQLSKTLGAANTPAVTTTYTYDANGNETNAAMPLSRTVSKQYDALNRVSQVTSAAGTTAFGYDTYGNLASVTDPRSLATTYTNNGFGERESIASPDTGTTTTTYNAAGNRATQTDARGKTGTFTYDALNRVTSIAYPDQTLSFTYDAGTNGAGHLTGASDANHTMSWTYNALGRISGKTQTTTGGIARTVSYGYTSGNLTSLTTPSGQVITYGYTQGRITSMTLNGATTILNSVVYEPFGPVRGWTWGNATTVTRTHDLDGGVSGITSAADASTYSYDSAMRITGTTATMSPAHTYGYDNADRLTSDGTTTWTYDAAGNRLTQGGALPVTYTVSGSSNRLNGAGTQSFGHDAAGNRTTVNSTPTYTYGDSGRLTALTSPTSVQFGYNALSQRILKSSTGGTTLFVYDEADHLLGEYDAAGTLIQETIWLGDIPVATLRPNGGGVSLYYLHSDHRDAPRKVTRPSDNVQMWTWEPDAFGVGAPNQNPAGAGTFVFNLRYPGQYYDSETGAYHNGAREYFADQGRYSQSDPIGLAGGINTYSYASSRPVSAIDPSGLFSMTWLVRYTYQRPLPSQAHPNAGGVTVPSIPITCRCKGCGGSWTLGECSAVLTLDIRLLAGVSDPREADFYRDSEDQHVADFKADMSQYSAAAEAAEAAERKLTPFGSRQACEDHAGNSLKMAMQPLLQRTWNQSQAKWDSGRHTWHSVPRFLGFPP